MGLSEASESEYLGRERRSSIRARSLLPCVIERVDPGDIMEVESLILDMSVLDSEHASFMQQDWADRADELSRDVRFVLSEVRALRQQITSIQRSMDLHKNKERWIVINDNGIWVPSIESDEFEEDDFVRVKLQIPSLSSPEVMALGEIVRLRQHPTRGGMAIEFRSITEMHKNAIIRYALKRERVLARSQLFSEMTRIIED